MRSAFNSHRPSTSGRVQSRVSNRDIENKQIDIDNYTDTQVIELSKAKN